MYSMGDALDDLIIKLRKEGVGGTHFALDYWGIGYNRNETYTRADFFGPANQYIAALERIVKLEDRLTKRWWQR